MGSPTYGPADKALGKERFERLIRLTAELDANVKLMLISASIIAGRREFTDDQLDALEQDGRDISKAGAQLGAYVRELAGLWRAQRQELEP
jgi:hypothetical protein